MKKPIICFIFSFLLLFMIVPNLSDNSAFASNNLHNNDELKIKLINSITKG